MQAPIRCHGESENRPPKPEVPGANGQGETIAETQNSLRQAIELILEDRKADILRGLPEDAIQETV
ncbi:MAG: hypothetical protein HY706_08360 [Candidatus Hydrogenedentes bacterium]|nr:hypothetical protein [Candidatus Hydrogenedentota bacterium]